MSEKNANSIVEENHEQRRRVLTEKGEQFKLETLNIQKNNANNKFHKEIENIKLLCKESCSISRLEEERAKLDDIKDEVNQVFYGLSEVIRNENEKAENYQWFDVTDREYNECRTILSDKIRSKERESQANLPIANDQKSAISLSSLRSSVESMRAKAAAKLAKLQVEMEFLDQESEMQKLAKAKEIAIAKAEHDAIYQVELDEEERTIPETAQMKVLKPSNGSQFSHISETSSCMSDGTLQEILKLQTKQAELSQLLVENHQLNLLPKQEPPVFDGNLFEFPAFIRAFETLIERRVSSQQDRLYFLNKYTKGKANQLIQDFMLLDTEDSFTKAKKLLTKRFGDPHRVSDVYKGKLTNWPKVKEGDSEGLQSFSDFLCKCEEAMKVMKSMSDLSSVETMRKVSLKLPSYAGLKWCRHAFNIKQKTDENPSFHDLVEFVKLEAEVANDPVFSPDHLKSALKKEFSESKKKGYYGVRSVNSCVTSARQGAFKGKPRDQSTVSCPMCARYHPLHECDEFKRKTLEERKEFIKFRRLCFGCLREGHISRTCRNRITCEVCNKNHPTCLHEFSPKKSDQIVQSEPQEVEDASSQAFTRYNSSNNSMSDDGINSLIMPVYVHHKSNPEVQVKVYALLDEASDTTFIQEETLKKLGVEGTNINLNLYTMSGKVEIATKKVNDLIVTRLDNKVQVELPKVYSRDRIPSKRNQIPTPKVASKWPHLQRIADKIQPYEEIEVGLLIGCDCPKAIKPREVILGRGEDPYGIRTILGWGIVGPVGRNRGKQTKDSKEESLCNRVLSQEINAVGTDSHCFVLNTPTKEVINPNIVLKMFEMDFSEDKTDEREKPISQEDRKFLNKVSDSIHLREDNHYEMELPLKEEKVTLPNNREMAVHRLQHLKKKLERNETYYQHYTQFMKETIEKGHAEKIVPDHEEKQEEGMKIEGKVVTVGNNQTEEKVWYIPHHGVYHPKKPDKLRVVFDCSAKFRGESLNNHLLQGPDLTNNLVGVLTRFRQEHIAIMCDIEGMFHQVKVTEHCRNLLRFLWWEDGNLKSEPIEYRMTVHLFGATSSPGCSNFALKTTANDNEEKLGTEAACFLRNDFYVDDGLKSLPTAEKAIQLVKSSTEMCRRGGFRLHKFVSNSKEVIESIPAEDRAKGIKNIDIEKDNLPIERALGVQWCIESDTFQFRIQLKDQPLTRRGILSTVSSVYDPLGLVAPVVLIGKQILQELCKANAEWDDPIQDKIRCQWEKWRNSLHLLHRVSISRCFKHEDFGPVVSTELHHFSDASSKAYGQCSYLRLQDEKGKIQCSFVMGKARVAPLKVMTIPRLELTAAVISANISRQIKDELEYTIDKEVFWTDSQVVLGYISNEAKRYHTFVANRIQQIRDNTQSSQWKYVATKSNPADDASRGLSPEELQAPKSRWLYGPEFLWKDESEWPIQEEKGTSPSTDDPEVRKVTSFSTQTSQSYGSILSRLEYFSEWYRAKKAVAICLNFKEFLKKKVHSPKQVFKFPNVVELKSAKVTILKLVQKEAFGAEIELLQAMKKNKLQERQLAKESKQRLKTTSSLYRLDPFLDEDGLLRVGGRIRRSNLPTEEKHPVILPKKGHVTQLIIRHYHEEVKHQGRGITMNNIRASGYWIIGGNHTVNNYISKCVICRKQRRPSEVQKMADLPEDRIQPAPPFTNSGVDCFGPFMIKNLRKEVKRYGVIFTCMASRGVHLEVAHSMETDSFINAYRRFISRRGPVRQLRCDQGTNFTGANAELKKCLQEFDNQKISSELMKDNCDWVHFNMNTPYSSHMGGAWERQIRTVRNVLSTLLKNHGSQLDDESLHTLMCEAEAIVNSRPLTIETLNDPHSLSPLTPNHLLTMKSKVILQPPGVFESPELYSRKRWRRVQHLTNEFWCRWRKEYLQSLQMRQKWQKTTRNVKVGDVVIVKDINFPRNQWPLARVTNVNVSKDGLVRTANLQLGDPLLDRNGKRTTSRQCQRPIHKLVVLMTTDSE